MVTSKRPFPIVFLLSVYFIGITLNNPQFHASGRPRVAPHHNRRTPKARCERAALAGNYVLPCT